MHYGISMTQLLRLKVANSFLIKGVTWLIFLMLLLMDFISILMFRIKYSLFNVVIRMTQNSIGHLSHRDRNRILENKLWRWIARNVPKPEPISYWCILLEREVLMTLELYIFYIALFVSFYMIYKDFRYLIA